MTLQSSGQISATNIIVEARKTLAEGFDIDNSLYRTIAKIPSAQSEIKYSDFYGKNYAYCIVATDSPTMAPWSVWAGVYGNNPGDTSQWPYGAWGADVEYSNSSGYAYYPLVAPGGPLYYTFGCDNYGSMSYANAFDQYANPAVLNYTQLCNNVAFPGITGWTLIGNFTAGAILWFYVGFRDVGKVFNMTFAVSSTASSSGILTHSRMLTAAGKPYYCMPGAILGQITAPPPPVYNEGVVAPASVLVNQQYNMSIVNGTPNSQFIYTQNGANPITLTLDGTGSYTFVNTYLNAAGSYVYEFTFLSTGHVRSVTTVATAPAPVVVTGSQNYTTPGTYTFTVPAFNTLIVNVWGGGGGGNRSDAWPYATNDNPGGTSSFGSYLSATGGRAAIYVGPDGNGRYVTADTNDGGTGSGGDINISGSIGYWDYPGASIGNIGADIGYSYGGAAGGTAYGGGAAKTVSGSFSNGTTGNGLPGNPYGGGGTGAIWHDNKYGGTYYYTGGGGGGFARKTFSAGSLTVGSTISVTVGAGGAGAFDTSAGITSGSGASGAVTISWS